MSFQTQFDLDIFWSIREKNEHKTGTLYLNPQEKFRIDLGGETFVSNGQTYWHYNKKVNQVTIDRAVNAELPFQPSELFRKYLSYNFTQVEKTSSETILESKTDPSEKSAYLSIKVWADNASGKINKLQLTDRNENVNTYTFRKTVFGAKIPAGVFNFDVPKDAQVLNNNE